jgi:hypothetical protein
MARGRPGKSQPAFSEQDFYLGTAKNQQVALFKSAEK